ncbi:MAG TPA: type III secretion system gatekeeper subunit SctW, partial [Rhabdochlamydiaceae bacterium]|nr:type III secretion system gatekeeper subunit SctW [Rhabdochlamydiaceae bacterium]
LNNMPGPLEPLEPTESTRILRQEQTDAQKSNVIQVAVEEAFTQWSDEAAFNPLTMARRFESLDEKRKKAREEALEKKEGEQVIERIQEISEDYSRKNPEFQPRGLLGLLTRLSARDTPEDILRKVLESYPDHSLADEALDFLMETSSGELLERVRKAKEDLNASYGRQVRAGRNMGAQAREFATQGLGSPTGLRDIYRDITGNPREASNLFSELSDKFTYGKMKTVINFLLHALGADLKSKGPSIATGELHRLMTEARNLQAILWVYRFFASRMKLIENSFQNSGLQLRLDFEILAKTFVQFLKERYPSMDKILALAAKLGISDELLAQIIIFTQMRDAIRGVAPKLFKSEQHRQDVLMSFLETLEELEEELEEKEEKEEDEKEKEKEKEKEE